MHRCLQRHDISRLPEVDGDKEPKKKFKSYPIGYFHIDIDGIATSPLTFGWPGWWSKMALFRPDIEGGILFMDIDTSIVGNLGDIIAVKQLAMMRNIYRPDGLQSSIMYLPQDSRAQIWAEWIERPHYWMNIYHKGGDQAFLEHFWLARAMRFQDLLPGQIVSWKAHVRQAFYNDEGGDGTIPQGTRIVIFHGKPHPWDIGW